MESQKVFNRWSCEGITVADKGLERYVNLEGPLVPRSCGRYAGNRFHKSKIFIVERLINKVMVPGHKGKKHFKTSGPSTGKYHTAYDLVEQAFLLIEQKIKRNPIDVFTKALENSAQREEIVTIEYGGARYPKAVECSPQRRVDKALRHMSQGAFHRSFNSKTPAASALADEIIAAYQLSHSSNAIAKKLEVERQADSSR